MSTKLATRKTKNVNAYSADTVIIAIFENGVFKPLSKVQLPQRQKFSLLIGSQEKSIAAQMHGLCKPQKQVHLDALIESEDWL